MSVYCNISDLWCAPQALWHDDERWFCMAMHIWNILLFAFYRVTFDTVDRRVRRLASLWSSRAQVFTNIAVQILE